MKAVFRAKPFILGSLALLLMLELVAWQFLIPLYSDQISSLDVQNYRAEALGEFFKRGQSQQETGFNTPHPFFGYLINPEQREIENFENLHPEPRPHVFRIGLFGGSVAREMSDFLNTAKGSKIFHDFVQRSGAIGDKKVEVIKMSAGGYRQPTALNLSLQYGQNFDLVLNLEGNNELKQNHNGIFPVYYPEHPFSLAFFSGIGNIIRLIEGVDLEKTRRAHKEAAAVTDWPLTLKLYHLFRELKAAKAALAWQSSLKPPADPFYPEGKEPTLKEVAKHWVKMSCIQQNVLADFEVPSLFFIQPLPFIIGSKPLSEVERQLLLKSTSEASQRDYTFEILPYAKALMKDANLSFSDLTGVFGGKTQTLYRDGCCHFNEEGHEIVAKVLAKRVVDRLRNRGPVRCKVGVLK